MPSVEWKDRRRNCTQAVRIGPSKIYLTVGFYHDETDEIGEIFISLEKTGSERRASMDEVSRLASKLLQHGCSVEALAEGWLGIKGRPSGPVSGDPRIKMCSSVLDYAARYLLVYFCQRDDLAHAAGTAQVVT